VLRAFSQFDVVALGERHWAKEDADFRIHLIHDPRFAGTVNDIVIEFGNSLYQDTLDRYIQGGPISPEQLRKVWRDTTQPGAWDSPVYEEFLVALRKVNCGLRNSEPLRVLAGEPPVDWEKVANAVDFKSFAAGRDQHAAGVIDKEVIAKGRKALVIYGAGHLYHNWNDNLTTVLESQQKTKIFVIAPIGGVSDEYAHFDAFAGDSTPSFIPVRGTACADGNAADVLERGTKRLKIVEGKRVVVPVFESFVPLGELIDACLYFGRNEPAFAEPDARLYSNTDYGRELQRRRSIGAAP
jgi:hypothetical protein